MIWIMYIIFTMGGAASSGINTAILDECSFLELVRVCENTEDESIRQYSADRMILLLDEPERCNLSYRDSNGISVVMALIDLKFEDVTIKALRMIKRLQTRDVIDVTNVNVFCRGVVDHAINMIERGEEETENREDTESNNDVDITFKCKNKHGDNIFTFSLLKETRKVSMDIVTYHPELIDPTFTNSFGYTPLMAAIYKDLNIVNRLLDNHEQHDLTHVNSDENSILMCAIYLENEEVIGRILKHLDTSALGHVNKKNNTALIEAIDRNLTKSALMILSKPEDCKMGHVSRTRDTALIKAINMKNGKVAMEMLNHPEMCNLSATDKRGNNAFITSVRSRMPDVIKAIMINYRLFRADTINSDGRTALSYAVDGDMVKTAIRIHRLVGVTRLSEEQQAKLINMLKNTRTLKQLDGFN